MLVLTTITKHTILRGSCQLEVSCLAKAKGKCRSIYETPLQFSFKKFSVVLFYSFCCVSYEVTKQIWKNST